MRKRLLLTAVAAATATTTLFAACKATDTAGNVNGNASAPMVAAAQTTNPNDARRVTVDELKKMLDEGKAVVYDTRAKSAYDAEHIKGALSMPSGEVADRAGELPKDKTIVFYCT
ncbi:MAG TPA: rhodanese-like domain-containing protein [Pyrinomonadaceae bacterium]|nr:rhodanese-like domain-containing protein [Pyrinomonadaceae bacterium]